MQLAPGPGAVRVPLPAPVPVPVPGRISPPAPSLPLSPGPTLTRSAPIAYEGCPDRPGDPERHRPGPCRSLEPAAPLHGAPRQHRPYRVWTPGGPSPGGFPTPERRALRRPLRRGIRPQGGRRLPRIRSPTSCPQISPSIWARATATATGTWTQIRGRGHERCPAAVAPGTPRVLPPHRRADGSSAAHGRVTVLSVSLPFSSAPPAGTVSDSPRSDLHHPRPGLTDAGRRRPGPLPDQARYNRGPVPRRRGDHD